MNKLTRVVVVGFLLAGLVGVGVFYNRPVTNAGSQSEEKVIQIKAKKFEFSPNTITLKKGEPVVFELTSEDRTHGFSLKEFGVRAEVSPSQPTRLRFTPDKTGEFSFACDVVCGGGHAEMSGKLVVTE
jgi:cytochrome c oxidase subunit 2